MLDSLHRRPRSRRFAPLLASLTGGALAGGESAAPEHGDESRELPDMLRSYVPPAYPDARPVTDALVGRLSDDDRAAVLVAADPEWRDYYSEFEAARPHLILQYAAHWAVEPALSRAGLTAAQPPEDVHAMARGPSAAAGGTWFADLVVEAAERAGVPVTADARVLDFGCSSGRVLRVLGAWRQDVEWIGCDPNIRAAEWAATNIPHATAFASPQEPPLSVPEASLDLVYAVSVWSHFGRTQAALWLDEMHRVIKPGGALIITTQGLPSLAHYLKRGDVSEEYACARARELLTEGHSYCPAFGEGGDWGVKHPEWGMAFLSADWLAATALPAWSLQLFQPARVDANQDLGVLIRR